MSENQTTTPVPAKVRQPRKISPFWLLPIVAFIIGAMLFFQILKEQGQMITIRFKAGDGITAGKTAIRYQGLQIGQVKKVYFVDDLKEVEVQAEINSEAKPVLRDGTKFWLVKPSASLAGISGLDTLVSGNYISLLPNDDEEAKSRYDFVAESDPPAITVADGDLLVRLHADDLGSMDIGSSVYFRKVPVGRVADYRFTADQKKVEIDLIIEKKYAQLVKKDSRFWNISGMNINASLSGLNVSMDSIASMILGAIAFDSPEDSSVATQASHFSLYPNLKTAKRGVEIEVLMPIVPNLKVNETQVFSDNLQIGVLSNLVMGSSENDENPAPKGMVRGTLLIDPAYEDLMRDGTRILLKEPKFSLDKEQISKIGELFRGIYFDVAAGKGEPKDTFIVQKETDYLLSLSNVLSLTFTAPQSYGVDEGQGIYANDVKIGEILKRNLRTDGVTFKAIIFPPYRHLIGANSKFVTVSNLDVSFGLDGLRVKAGSPSEWLQGGVRLMSGKAEGKAKSQYPLYKDEDNAIAGITSNEKKATRTLTAQNLSGIDKGSVVLYRDFQVGEVLSVRALKSQFEVDLYIEPKHRNLLSENARFWIEPAAAVDISPNGVNIQAAPLMRTLKGAISFDNNGAKGNKTLYASRQKAQSGNTYITLIANDGSKLSKGMPIKYLGLTVGNVEQLQLDSAKKQIKATAYIEGQYHSLIAKSGSRFTAISPEVTTAGFKNLDAALQNYISVEITGGKAQTQFRLKETDTIATQYANGFPVILESSDANGILPEAPVFYRGLQVGIVKRMSLNELGDRVRMHLLIENRYSHLVRRNTQFWQASGYTMDISFNGVSMNSGTMSQLLNGGIAFSTPSGKVVQPKAEPNRRFLLQRKTPNGAESWDQGAYY